MLRDFYQDCNCGCLPETKTIELADPTPADDDFFKKVFKGELKDGQIHSDYYFDVAKKLAAAVKKGVGLSTVKVGDNKGRLFERLKHNVFAFSAAKSLTMLQEYKKQLRDEEGNDRNYSAFRNAVTPVNKEFNDNYLRTEYNNAVATSQMANKWDSLQQFDYLEYRTVGDNRVRPEHAKLDGIVLHKDDKLWDTIYPPNSWNCRCTVVPSKGKASVNRDQAQQVKDSKTIAPYFKKNVGTEQVIFSDDHPYFARATQDIAKGKIHQFMAEENYGMRPIDKILEDKKLPAFTTATNIEEAKEAWSKANKKIKTADGLEWDMNDRWDHVAGDNSGDRWKYINHAKDVLENADEVWSTKVEKTIYKRYVKYYHGQPIVFSHDIDDPTKWTMYAADAESNGQFKKMRDLVRKGILIHRK